jgi:hypothetical protein
MGQGGYITTDVSMRGVAGSRGVPLHGAIVPSVALDMTRAIDISWKMSPKATHWKDKEPRLKMETTASHKGSKEHSNAHTCTGTTLHSYDVHVGTHVDAPLHFLEKGASIDAVCSLVSCFLISNFPPR